MAPADLDGVLRVLPSDANVGKTLERGVTAAEVIALVAKHRGKEIPIEEQDHSWYIMHLSPWVSVSESSPLFEALRREHARWLREWAEKHPER